MTLANFLKDLKASFFATRKKVQVNIEKSSTITNV